MKIRLEQADLSEPEIIVRGDVLSPQVKNIMELLNVKQSLQKIFFFKDEREYLFDITDDKKRHTKNHPLGWFLYIHYYYIIIDNC